MFSFFKKINSSSQTITSAAAVIGALSLISRFLGVVRDRVLASEFGAGSTLDAYYAAFRLPDLVYNLLILGAVSAGLIPVFTALLAKNQKDSAWKLINSIINILAISLIIICLFLFVSATWLMPLITPGFNQEQLDIVVKLSQIMFLSPLFLGLSAIFSSILQSFRKFLIYAIAPIFYNLGIIIGAIFFTDFWGVYGLAWGVVLGAFTHMVIQLWPIFSTGYNYKLEIDFRDKNVIAVGKLMIPRTLALAITQLNFLIITLLASTMAAGSLAIFNLSNNLQNFPLGIFGVSLAVASLPVLSSLAAKKKMDDFVNTISTTFRQILFFILPLSAIMYVLRAQIVRVVLGAGQFDWYDTRLTAASLAIFCLGLFAQGTFPLIIRGFYAVHNTKIPFWVGVASMVVNVTALFLFSWVFSFDNWINFFVISNLKIYDLYGLVDLRVLALPAAITVSSIFELLVLMFCLRAVIGRLDGRKIASSGAKIIISALGSGLLTYLALQLIEKCVQTETFIGIFFQGLLAGLLGMIGFLILGYVFKMEELSIFIQSMRRKFFREAKVVMADNINESDS